MTWDTAISDFILKVASVRLRSMRLRRRLLGSPSITLVHPFAHPPERPFSLVVTLTAPAPQLFNLADEPGEKVDLATQNPLRAADMLSKLDTWFEEVEAERLSIPAEQRHPRPISARFS